VAELEATTVRKGNKKVTVTLYGQINLAVLFWDDGSESNAYTVDNNYESSRFGINKKYGTVNLGLTATPKYDITKDTMEYISTEKGEVGGHSDVLVPDFRMNDSFKLRETGFNNAEALTNAPTWVSIAKCYSAGDQFNCSTRRNGVSYNSPSFAGFSTQWGWFEDDIWGGAVRYRNTDWADTWLLAVSAAYEGFRDERLMNGGGGIAGFRRDFQEWARSAALKHKPTACSSWAYGATPTLPTATSRVGSTARARAR
jgi:predicted porin